tara:strand:- start:230 stop:496 length:267 start_codon:yes stop_codon:yes gene_type:complete
MSIITEEMPIPDDLKDLDEAQIAKVIADSKLADLRAERTRRLAETDWTQNPDVPEATRKAWATYRQELRDLTITQQDLNGCEWPTPPS